jgi:primosomal protein N' (replication factor Y)
VQDLIKKAQKNNNRTFLLTSRKGLSPLIICGDCGHTVNCQNCSSPVVLYAKKNKSADPQEQENYFRCHHCGEIRSAGETCKYCSSWNLKMFGYGIDRIAEIVKNIIPENNVFVLDKEKAPTQKQAREIINNFTENPAGVLVGTEMALLYLREEVENVVIISIDSMFSIPDFQIKERILNILLRARAKTINNFIIQTRNVSHEIFKEAINGNLADFYRQEFIERKKFNYPPFSILIKITGFADNKSKLEKDFEGIKLFLQPEELNYYAGFVQKIKNQFVMHGLIKIPRSKWIHHELAEKLKHLPQQFRVEVDAQSII